VYTLIWHTRTLLRNVIIHKTQTEENKKKLEKVAIYAAFPLEASVPPVVLGFDNEVGPFVHLNAKLLAISDNPRLSYRHLTVVNR